MPQFDHRWLSNCPAGPIACQAAGLPGLVSHDLRRANATGMVAEGVDLKTAQTRLGHSDPHLTLAIYAQATTEADQLAAERLGARFMRCADSDVDLRVLLDRVDDDVAERDRLSDIVFDNIMRLERDIFAMAATEDELAQSRKPLFGEHQA